MYKVKGYFKREDVKMEGLIIEDHKGNEFLTSGVYKWKITEDKLKQIKIVDNINLDKFMDYWNRFFNNCKLEF